MRGRGTVSPASVGETSLEKCLDSLNVDTRERFKTRPVPVRHHKRERGTLSQPSMENRTSYAQPVHLACSDLKPVTLCLRFWGGEHLPLDKVLGRS